MSGGVDSSVTAALLKREGHEVVGLFMKNWEEEGDCQAAADYEDVALVCHELGIPHYTVNLSKQYWDLVFARCLADFREGLTPNPDILCNQEIKFKVFLEKALALDGAYLATGHYARKIEKDGRICLGRGVDPEKDQSYFLYTLKEEVLKKVLFPLGGMEKKEVRALARKFNLPTASKKDSTGICFIGKRDFRDFLSRYIPKEKGAFETLSGAVVGDHEGMAYYTIGQRKGLGIGGKGEAWYVVGKDPKRNVVFVEQGEHEALFRESLTARNESFVNPVTFPFKATAKVRYRAGDVPCLVERMDDRLKVTFDSPQKAITSGQSIVFYDGDICLGGAIID